MEEDLDDLEISSLYEDLHRAEWLAESLRDYACHKIGCARLKEPAAKCDCGLAELLIDLRAD